MFRIQNAVLLIIDVQGKLASLMHEKGQLFTRLKGLIRAAQILEIPIIYTEQVPEKIGKTVPEVAELFKNQPPITKTSFSCWGSDPFQKKLLGLKRKQIFVAGIETHVCVYQTVADLLEAKFEVQVVADAVSARSCSNHQIAIERMKTLGAGITCLEMITCELLRTADHAQFKDILALIK